MRSDDFFVRVSLTLVVFLVTALLFVPYMVFKVFEGCYTAGKFVADWTQQVWRSDRKEF